MTLIRLMTADGAPPAKADAALGRRLVSRADDRAAPVPGDIYFAFYVLHGHRARPIPAWC